MVNCEKLITHEVIVLYSYDNYQISEWLSLLGNVLGRSLPHSAFILVVIIQGWSACEVMSWRGCLAVSLFQFHCLSLNLDCSFSRSLHSWVISIGFWVLTQQLRLVTSRRSAITSISPEKRKLLQLVGVQVVRSRHWMGYQVVVIAINLSYNCTSHSVWTHNELP